LATPSPRTPELLLLPSSTHSQPISPGGQIASDAGLLPLRAFDQRHRLTRELAASGLTASDDEHPSTKGLK